MSRATDAVGAYGERVAVRTLTDAGMSIIDRNWRCAAGEIDIVALDGSTLVFCEVKTRRGEATGAPAEAVTAAKVRRLRALAAVWLAAHPADPRTDPVRRGQRLAAAGRAGGGRAPARGVLRWDTPGCARSGWSARRVTRSPWRRTSPAGCPASSCPACPTPRSTRPATGSAPRWSTPASPGPHRRITVNLLPADLPKRGSGFDLAIARRRAGRRAGDQPDRAARHRPGRRARPRRSDPPRARRPADGARRGPVGHRPRRRAGRQRRRGRPRARRRRS